MIAQYANVIVPVPGNTGYTYKIPDNLAGQVEPGHFVTVPIGPRPVRGLVWEIKDDVGDLNPKRVREVAAKLDVSPLPKSLLELLGWCSRYTLTAPGNLLRLVQPPKNVLLPIKQRTRYALIDTPASLKITKARQAFLDAIAEMAIENRGPRLVSDWSEATGVSEAVVRGLVKAGQFAEIQSEPVGNVETKPSNSQTSSLSPAQSTVYESLKEELDKGFGVSLLDGVTGSGKTHVYTELIRDVLAKGQSVLVLLPEIALTSDILSRLAKALDVEACPWHSDVTPAAKAAIWQLLQNNSNLLVVGARSALWLPFRNLGLVIVDEEHDGSYKQSEGALYNARDMAIVRSKIETCPIVLASATPTLETWYHAHNGKYKSVRLTERVGDAALPEIQLIDLCEDRPPNGRWISGAVEYEIRETLKQKRQALLFLNKRGYAPLSLCRACGYRFSCGTCSAWMTEHRLRNTLECHHCGLTLKKPTQCPECKEEGSITAVGPGVERLSEEVASLFPEARVGLGSSDTLYSTARTAEFITGVKEGTFDIIIGTQILAKGHNFRNLNTVAVVDADMGLSGGDPRAAEQTFQLLTQISGRAGRFGEQGRVLVQTSQPDDPLMQCIQNHDRENFISNELRKRQFQLLPPFGRLTSLILSDPDPVKVDAVARDLINRAPKPGDTYRILGPAPAPIAVIRGRHRRRFLLQSYHGATPQKFLKVWLADFKLPGSTRLTIDIDPYSFL